MIAASTSRARAPTWNGRPLRTESQSRRGPRAVKSALLTCKYPPAYVNDPLYGSVHLGFRLHEGRRGVGHPRVVVAILDQSGGINQVSAHFLDPAHDPDGLA